MLFTDIKNLLRDQGSISVGTMGKIYDRDSRWGLVETARNVASEINEDIGAFLPHHLLNRFISAELVDAEASQIAADRKRFLKRSAELLPELLRLFKVSNDDRFIHLVRRIDDFCSDFPTISSLPHSKRGRREAREKISSLIDRIRALDDSLLSAERLVEIDFKHHLKAAASVRAHPFVDKESFDIFDLKKLLDDLMFVSRLILKKDEMGEDPIYIVDNKLKTYIVEETYITSLSHGTPELVTTPGSDFSYACSLLYEIASGEKDASLAGAINRFARSAERKRIDVEEEESRWEESSEGVKARESDNFAHIKEKISRLQSEMQKWTDIFKSGNWSESESGQFAIRMASNEIEIEDLNLKHGPFLVWASQYSEADQLRWQTMFEEKEKRMLELATELGKQRRSKRS